MSAPAASIVVCTRNRAKRLPACLDAIAAIRCPTPWELVVVDNGSTDETPEVLARYEESFPVPVVVVDEPVPGVARARNRGWETASGAVVVFTDDDCYPAEDLLARYLRRFDDEPSVAFVAGSVVLHDPEDARVTTVTRPAVWRVRPGTFITPGEIVTANLAVRRDILERVGGFDELFAYGAEGLAGSDLDLVARISAADQGVFDPDIVVRHHHGRRDPEDVLATRRSYDRGRGAFYAKCVLDRRLRRTYVRGWLALTGGRVRRRESLRPVLRELRGALAYVGLRVRSRLASSGSVAP